MSLLEEYLEEAQGCSALQGYLLGRPMPIRDVERMVSASGMGHA